MDMNDEGFWWFAHERQRIWHARTVHGLPPPWTSDDTLSRFRFCNVHRELDRGTRWLLIQLHAHEWLPIDVLVRNLLVHRYFNRQDVTWAETHEEIVAGVRERMRRTDGQVFSGTWMTGGGQPGRPLREMLPDWVANWDVPKFIDVARRTTTLADVHAELLGLRGVGPVVAWQQALDMTYVFGHLSDDEWVPRVRELYGWNTVVPTHGPALAARDILDVPFTEVVHRLRDEQDERLARWGLNWSQVAWSHKPRLTLADVEHTLCEYQRYLSVRAGKGRRRGFVIGSTT